MPVSGRRAFRPDSDVLRHRRRKTVSRIAILDIFRGNKTGPARRGRRRSISRVMAILWFIAVLVLLYFIWRRIH